MICLSSDIHHMSMCTNDQSALKNETEAQIGNRFAEQCASRGIHQTLFLTGRLVKEEYNSIRGLSALPDTELGGHTFNAFKPELFHRLCNKFINAHNGPYWYQQRDVKNTIDIISARFSQSVVSWRNHAYLSDKNTLPILLSQGIRLLSDGTSKTQVNPEESLPGLSILPINVMPDHEHLIHGKRCTDYIQNQQSRFRFKWTGAFENRSYEFRDWFQRWTTMIEQREQCNERSVILIHPICIYLAGGDDALDSVVDFLSQFESQTLGSTV